MSCVYVEHPRREDAEIDAVVWKIQFSDFNVEVRETLDATFRVIRSPKAAAEIAFAAPLQQPWERLDRSDADHPGLTAANVKGLLHLIGTSESGDDYNAVPELVMRNEHEVTRMSVENVLNLQRSVISEGQYGSGCGRYRLVYGCLISTREQLGLTGQEVFDQSVQDRCAVSLLRQCGLNALLSSLITVDRFIDNLAMQWPSLPTTIGRSYYARPTNVSVAQMRQTVTRILT